MSQPPEPSKFSEMIFKSTYQFIQKYVFKKSKSQIKHSCVSQLKAITEYFDVLWCEQMNYSL